MPEKDKLPSIKGRIVSVIGPVVDVEFATANMQPAINEVLKAETFDEKEVVLEVVENLAGNITRCIALNTTIGLQRNTFAEVTGSVIRTPVGEGLCGRLLNCIGQPIDKLGPIKEEKTMPIRKNLDSSGADNQFEQLSGYQVLLTGIKMLDLLFPLVKGTKTGILGGAALGKSILTLELINNVVRHQSGICVFTGAGERIREGNELYNELQRQKILDRVALVFGQMDEPPGARFEVALTGVTIAEYFKEQGKDVLFFIDNVFRFAQAGAELSTLIGRIPSETGYQPTLPSEMSEFQERIRSSKSSSITAIEAVYVPSDDLTDPAVVCIFSYLNTMLVLSRDYIQRGLYPAIDPLKSSCSFLDPLIIGKRHFQIAQDVLRIFNKYEELRRIASIIGIEELSQSERILFERAQKLQNFLTQPFFTAELYTARKGEFVELEETLTGCQKILEGKFDKVAPEHFYMIGAIKEDMVK